jgi:signal peptidase I
MLAWAALVVSLLAGLWFLLPVHLGGRTALVIVKGESMEPFLQRDDLAATREANDYRPGDLIAFRVDDGNNRGMVIHRIVSGSAETGWATQGDNNSWVDNWTVPDSYILGRYWFTIDGGGRPMTWVLEHPYMTAGITGLFALALFVPHRRRRLAPELRSTLQGATKAPRRSGREPSDALVLGFTFAGALAAGWVTFATWVGGGWGAGAWMSLAGFVVCAGFVTWIIARLYNGRGVTEPTKSLLALSDRAWDVAELPPVNAPTPVRSALALRTIAEKYRLPVLHAVDSATEQHQFLLITVQKGNFQWDPPDPFVGTASDAAGS